MRGMRLGYRQPRRPAAMFAIGLLSLLAFTCLQAAALQAAAPNHDPRGTLLRVVMLSRHGVRSPTQSTEALNSWRQQPPTPPVPPWPDFGVPPGYLTPRGEQLVEKLGEYYRSYLDQNGMFDPAQCPDEVLIRADRDERTVMTAHGLGSGLAQAANAPLRCRFAIEEAADGPDPLFHPSEAMPANCALDSEKAEKAVGDLKPLAQRYEKQITAEQDILQCCSPQLCERPACSGTPISPLSCKLPELPSCTDAAKGQAAIKGGLGIGQSFAEILLLEYGQGFTGDKFGFGRAGRDYKATMLDILGLHTAVFNEVQRAHYVAARQGANLLYHVVGAIKTGLDPGSPGGPYKFVAYVGHDTNIANLAALLDLHWQLPEYPLDDMPPGGALVFELRQPSNQAPIVDAFFAAQSPDEMQSGAGEPERAPVKTRRCPANGGHCEMVDFVVPLAEFIDMTTPILQRNRGCLTD